MEKLSPNIDRIPSTCHVCQKKELLYVLFIIFPHYSLNTIKLSPFNLIDISLVLKCLVNKCLFHLPPRLYLNIYAYQKLIFIDFLLRLLSFYPFLFFYKPQLLAQSRDYISLLIQCYLIISVHPGVPSCRYGPSRSLAYTHCNTKVKVNLSTFLSMEAVHKNVLYIFYNHD